MADTVYFHIGSVKTGTTMLQKFCYEKRENLLGVGVDYIEFEPPRLDLPRWANADYILNAEFDAEFVRDKMAVSSARSILISEEGIMSRPDIWQHPVFSSMRRVIILYMRNSIELVASWASENSLPYNFNQDYHSSGRGVVSIDEGMDIWSFAYRKMLTQLSLAFDDDPGIEVRIRPFPVVGRDNLLQDFLQQLDIPTNVALGLAETNDTEVINEGRSRRYCDAAYLMSQLAIQYDVGQLYNTSFVDRVCARLRSGDPRKVIHTLSGIEKLFVKNRLTSAVQTLMDRYGQIEQIHAIPLQPIDQTGPYVRIDQQELTQLFLEAVVGECRMNSLAGHKANNHENTMSLKMQQKPSIEDEYRRIVGRGSPSEIEGFNKKCVELSMRYSKEKKYEAAVPYLKMLCLMEKNNAHCWNNLGLVLAELRQFNDACESFKVAVDLDPQFINAAANLSYCFMMLENTAESKKYANTVLTEAPENQLALGSLAFCYTISGEIADSERIILQLDIAYDNNLFIASLLRAWNKFQLGRHVEALWELSVVAENWPHFEMARVVFQRCFARYATEAETKDFDALLDALNLTPPPISIGSVDAEVIMPRQISIDVVIPIYNSLQETMDCLASIRRYQTPTLGNLILVNDNSDLICANWLKQYADAHPDVILFNNSENRGFSYSAQKGVSLSSAEFVILLNSDTIIGKDWIEGLWCAISSRSDAAAAGPWSNQANFQTLALSDRVHSRLSSTELTDERNLILRNCQFGISKYPVVPLLSGFCLMLRRSVFLEVGGFDSEAFPRGYWESHDLCLRLIDIGMVSVVAADVYVHHSGGKSISEEQRDAPINGGLPNLYKKHSAFRVLCSEALCNINTERRLISRKMLNGDLNNKLIEEAGAIKNYSEVTILSVAQDFLFPSEALRCRRLMVMVVPEHNDMSGGIYSFFSIANHMHAMKRIHGYDVLVMTRPNESGHTFLRLSAFRNAETVYRLEQLLLCDMVEELYLHIPEYSAHNFCDLLSPELLKYLKSRKKLYINIMNQNITLMPEPAELKNLRELTPEISQSVAHHAYFGQEFADRYGLPTLLLPAYTDLSSYPGSSFEEKRKLIIYSKDEAPHRNTCLNILKREFGNYEQIEIRDMSFDRYMQLATDCQFSISFGEGFDGYIAQPVHQGGIGLTVYRKEFFPSDHFLNYYNIFRSQEEMVEELALRIRRLSSDPQLYKSLNRQFKEEHDKLYSLDDYVRCIRKLVLRNFDLIPIQNAAAAVITNADEG